MSRLFACLVVGLPLLAVACSSSSTPPAGKMCVVNTDCNNPLSCTFGKCHVDCTATRDCPLGQRCVKGPVGVNVCQLSDEKLCPVSGGQSTCQAPLACAIDLQCRNHCTTAADCTSGQACASGYCAEATEVNGDGTLKVGTADAGATTPDAGMTAMDGPVADNTPTTGLGPCGVPETEPNDTRDNPTPLTVPAMLPSCIGTTDDVDFYELTAPDDMTGGYFQISVTDVTFEIDLIAYSATDKGQIGELVSDSAGQDLSAYLAAAPGQKYWISVAGFAGARPTPAKYNLKVTYTKVPDLNEPNNTKDTAKAITLGTPVMSYVYEGLQAQRREGMDVADWYTVMGAAGNLTVTVENVPSDVEIDIQIYDSAGKKTEGVGTNAGANLTWTLMDGAAGSYRVLITPFAISNTFFFGRLKSPTALPEHFTQPYKMTVSQ